MTAGGERDKRILEFIELLRRYAGCAVHCYPIMKGAVLAIAKAFGPDWCAAAPHDLGVVDDTGRYEIAPTPRSWMINLSPRLAPLVVPPRSAIHEYAADGSLFMTATTDTFLTQNSKHFAVAQDIFAVTDPLNFKAPPNPRR